MYRGFLLSRLPYGASLWFITFVVYPSIVVDSFVVNFGNTLLGNAACVFMASAAIQVSNVPDETQFPHSPNTET